MYDRLYRVLKGLNRRLQRFWQRAADAVCVFTNLDTVTEAASQLFDEALGPSAIGVEQLGYLVCTKFSNFGTGRGHKIRERSSAGCLHDRLLQLKQSTAP